MASKFYSGKDGVLRVGGTTQYRVTSWNFEASLEVLDTTSLGHKVRHYSPGVQSFSGATVLKYYQDDSDRNDAAALLKNLIRTDTSTDVATVEFTLRLQDGSLNKDITFNAYITSASFGAVVGDIVSANVKFKTTGDLTEATI